MTPRVSIILLNYNYDAFLAEAISSVFSQSFRDWELLIADDGSTDGSLVTAARYAGERCRIMTGDRVGLEGNLERGLQESQGELVAITSADDRWLDNHLEIGVAALDAHPDVCCSYSLMRSIDEGGRPIPRPQTLRNPVFPSGRVSPLALLPGQFIPTQSTIFRRAAIDRIGGFDPSLHLLELDLLVRLVARYPVVFTGRTTAEYRLHGDSLSSDPSRMLAARLALYDKHFAGLPRDLRRRYEAGAYLKTAYKELVRHPTPESVRSARRHIISGLRSDPRTAAAPLHLAMLGASCAGPFYPTLFRAASRLTFNRRLKAISQRALGVAGASHHSFVAAKANGRRSPADRRSGGP